MISNCIFFYCSATQWLLKWQNFHRFYLYVLTENVKSIILKHRHILLCEDTITRCGLIERDIVAAATLPELGEFLFWNLNFFKRKHSKVSKRKFLNNKKLVISFEDQLLTISFRWKTHPS